MRNSMRLLQVLGVFCAIAGVTLAHYHDPWASPPSDSPEDDDDTGSPPRGFSVVSGPIDEDVSQSWPWAHHVDFNERFPGEDQIAEESQRESRVEVPTRQRPQWPRQHQQPQFDVLDDIIVPDFARIFNEGPQIGDPQRQRPTEDSSSEEVSSVPMPQEPIGNYDQPWWNLFGLSPVNVWWKGSNVCVKREEDESQSDETSSSGTDDGFKMHFSMCSQQDTRYMCITRQQPPGAQRAVTVRTMYECCQGYTLDDERKGCVRGGNQDVLTTIEQIGGTEFIRLIKMVGLESKLKSQNLTVFVPSNEALVKYIRAHQLESNSIQFFPQPPQPEKLIRGRRNILMHAKNEPGGRNVRRRGGESKGRGSRGETQDLFPVDLSSSSEEDSVDQVFRIPMVKRSRSQSQQQQTARSDYEEDTDDDDEGQNNGVSSPRENNFGPYYGLEGSNKGDLEQMLLNQMLSGKLSTDDFIDEKVLFTENVNEEANEVEITSGQPESHHHRQGSVVRLNTWFIPPQGQIYTVNCVPVTSMNNKCSNGIVHVVDNVFQPVTQSIGELLSNNPQLSLFRSYLNAAGLLSMFEKSDEHLTLLAPTNEALESIDPSIQARIRNGDACLKKILRRHILPITFCSSVIHKEGRARNIDMDILDIVRDSEDRLFINGSEMIRRDSVATNGVIHVLNKVIISENDKKLSEILRQDGFSTFLTMMNKVGLDLDDMENITVFAPSNDALEASITEDILSDPRQLKELLMFHVAKPETSSCSLKEKETLPSLLPGRSLHINPMTIPLWPLISSFPIGKTTVQCAKIGERGGRGCNGVYHEINRMMVPPTSTLFGVLQASPKFTAFTRLLIDTLDETSLELLGSENQTLTVFAPSNEAFKTLSRSETQRLKSDKQYANRVINRHIFRDVVCCSEVYPVHNIFFRMLTALDGSVVASPLSSNYDGSIRFGPDPNGSVTSCDLMSVNGVVQTVDKVSIDENLMSNTRRCRSCTHAVQPQMQFFNFGR